MLQTDNFRDFRYDKGDFNDVIIGNYIKEADEKGFQQVSITEYSGDDRISKSSKGRSDIDELLSIFDNLYLVTDKERWYSLDTKYKISFDNTNTHESVDISIIDESHINVWITLVDKKINKKKKIIHYDQDHIYYGYHIQEGRVDQERIEEIFNSIDI